MQLVAAVGAHHGGEVHEVEQAHAEQQHSHEEQHPQLRGRGLQMDALVVVRLIGCPIKVRRHRAVGLQEEPDGPPARHRQLLKGLALVVGIDVGPLAQQDEADFEGVGNEQRLFGVELHDVEAQRALAGGLAIDGQDGVGRIVLDVDGLAHGALTGKQPLRQLLADHALPGGVQLVRSLDDVHGIDVEERAVGHGDGGGEEHLLPGLRDGEVLAQRHGAVGLQLALPLHGRHVAALVVRVVAQGEAPFVG